VLLEVIEKGLFSRQQVHVLPCIAEPGCAVNLDVSVDCGVRVDDGLVSVSLLGKNRNHDRIWDGDVEVAGR
jgi:hypothetical protein